MHPRFPLPRAAILLLIAALAPAGCGVPRGAAGLAAAQASATLVPADDAAVRAALLQQDAAWQSFATLVGQRQFGGIGVDSRFTELVQRAAALAARQRQLIETGGDDPIQNRATLDAFRTLWQQTTRYLNP